MEIIADVIHWGAPTTTLATPPRPLPPLPTNWKWVSQASRRVATLVVSLSSFILVATGSHGRNKNKRWQTATQTTTKTTSESSLLMLFSCFSCLSGLVASCGGETRGGRATSWFIIMALRKREREAKETSPTWSRIPFPLPQFRNGIRFHFKFQVRSCHTRRQKQQKKEKHKKETCSIGFRLIDTLFVG